MKNGTILTQIQVSKNKRETLIIQQHAIPIYSNRKQSFFYYYFSVPCELPQTRGNMPKRMSLQNVRRV